MLYLFFGYAVVFTLLGGYLYYLFQRLNRLEKTLKELESKGEAGREKL